MMEELERRINKCTEKGSKELHLNAFGLGDEVVIYLASRLHECVDLRYLSLNSNRIGNKGMIALASALKKMIYMKYLELDSNEIGNKGAIALALALPGAPHILHLRLHGNIMGDDVRRLVQEALVVNQYNYCHRTRTMKDRCLMAIEDTSFVSSVVLINFERRKRDNYLLFLHKKK